MRISLSVLPFLLRASRSNSRFIVAVVAVAVVAVTVAVFVVVVVVVFIKRTSQKILHNADQHFECLVQAFDYYANMHFLNSIKIKL